MLGPGWWRGGGELAGKRRGGGREERTWGAKRPLEPWAAIRWRNEMTPCAEGVAASDRAREGRRERGRERKRTEVVAKYLDPSSQRYFGRARTHLPIGSVSLTPSRISNLPMYAGSLWICSPKRKKEKEWLAAG